MSKPGILLLGGLAVLVIILYSTSVLINSSNNAATTKSFIQTSEILLSKTQKDELKKLGLKHKNPVRITTTVDGAVHEQVIHGRFLHLTDFHPDPYYKVGSKIDEQCHSGKATPENGGAGKYGDAILGCDAPMVLVKDTVEWIKNNLRDEIDFIVWTGDNVRHDNDRRFPRTEQVIFDLNQEISDLLYETFKSTNDSNMRSMDVDLIPSLGNNDVYPHNLFLPGPTLQTRELFKIWKNFVPQAQLHTFNKGAYYFHEVIPNHLAVLSLNTLYLFDLNPLVDNCDSKKQPGYQLFEWLGYVLKEMRARNMKVWLSGHVPPNGKNYDISCLRKYIVWSYEYRDVIIGGLYGHMNIDHFIPLDSKAAYKSIKDSRRASEFVSVFGEVEDVDAEDEAMFAFGDNEVRITGGTPHNKVSYMEMLRETLYAAIKGEHKAGNQGERYAIAHVSASVVPTFNLGLRVWEYNITGLKEQAELHDKYKFAPWDQFFTGLSDMMESVYADEEEFTTLKKDKTFPPKMPKNAKLGPAYVPQTFTPERYVQYYADLKDINDGKKDFGYEIQYATDDKLYGLKDLTVKEWLSYGRKLGKPVKKTVKKPKEKKKLENIWEEYLHNAFISSGYETAGYG